MSDEFLGLSMNIVLRTYFKIFLDQSPLHICLGTCAGERKAEFSLHVHVLGDFVDTKQYLLPYVSNFN